MKKSAENGPGARPRIDHASQVEIVQSAWPDAWSPAQVCDRARPSEKNYFKAKIIIPVAIFLDLYEAQLPQKEGILVFRRSLKARTGKEQDRRFGNEFLSFFFPFLSLMMNSSIIVMQTIISSKIPNLGF